MASAEATVLISKNLHYQHRLGGQHPVYAGQRSMGGQHPVYAGQRSGANWSGGPQYNCLRKTPGPSALRALHQVEALGTPFLDSLAYPDHVLVELCVLALPHGGRLGGLDR
jgi:hypothetical protein